MRSSISRKSQRIIRYISLHTERFYTLVDLYFLASNPRETVYKKRTFLVSETVQKASLSGFDTICRHLIYRQSLVIYRQLTLLNRIFVRWLFGIIKYLGALINGFCL